ncbi:MAG: hypothetical protein PHP82_03745 [Candidatus ainarchaeum sp.]|nr:hypothetical protein [Candidatus ainarchaeum sp.]
MVKKIVRKKSEYKNLEILENKTSWKKIAFAIIAGILLGYFFVLNKVGSIAGEIMLIFIILSLLSCVLAILLDIRRILLTK